MFALFPSEGQRVMCSKILFFSLTLPWIYFFFITYKDFSFRMTFALCDWLLQPACGFLLHTEGYDISRSLDDGEIWGNSYISNIFMKLT